MPFVFFSTLCTTSQSIGYTFHCHIVLTLWILSPSQKRISFFIFSFFFAQLLTNAQKLHCRHHHGSLLAVALFFSLELYTTRLFFFVQLRVSRLYIPSIYYSDHLFQISAIFKPHTSHYICALLPSCSHTDASSLSLVSNRWSLEPFPLLFVHHCLFSFGQ